MERADVEGSMEKQLRWVRRVSCRGAVSSTLNVSPHYPPIKIAIIFERNSHNVVPSCYFYIGYCLTAPPALGKIISLFLPMWRLMRKPKLILLRSYTLI